MRKKIARLAQSQEDYTRLGLKAGMVEPREDGLHTSGRFGEYEWWYFDAKLNDGWSLVIGFYSQPVTAACIGFAPSITFALTRGEEVIRETIKVDAKDCSMSREGCCVRYSESCFEGDLHTYHIHVAGKVVQADVKLTANAASWRPETGHFLFDEKKFFAWLPSVPEGSVEATITANGQTMSFTGTGYHDHNWGNIGMYWVMHHWYWGRAKVGDYQVISSYITAHKPYDYEHFPIFLLLKNGEKLGDDPRYLTYTQSEPAFDPVTRKHYHQKLCYDYNDGQQHVRVTYAAKEIIEYFTVANAKTSAQAKASGLLMWIVRQARLDPSYIRMTGTVTLERFEGNTMVERVEAPGLWEQMYFGLDEDV